MDRITLEALDRIMTFADQSADFVNMSDAEIEQIQADYAAVYAWMEKAGKKQAGQTRARWHGSTES